MRKLTPKRLITIAVAVFIYIVLATMLENLKDSFSILLLALIISIMMEDDEPTGNTIEADNGKLSTI